MFARTALPCAGAVSALVLLLSASSARAHGMIGQRFFPATLAIDDPFVADELSLPTLQTVKRQATEDEPRTRETEIEAELSKRLSRDFGLSISGTLDVLSPTHGETVAGFDNLSLGAKYVFWKSVSHELLVSAGLDADVGGTGMKKVGADSFSTLTPGFFFGRGFGDLPVSLAFLRPFAVTGQLGLSIPTQGSTETSRTVLPDGQIDVERTANPRTFDWGLTLQYNLQYLQSYVRDVGLPAPFDRMIPLVEFPFQTTVQGASHTTGTINPGVIWFGRYIQIGLEAVVPIHGNTFEDDRQRGVGFLGQIHFYLDDIWPEGFTWTPFEGVLGPTQPR
jgi:hypothetical protein